MNPLMLRLLGGFEVQADLGRPRAVPTRKAQALLAYLALTPGQAHPRDKLAALLWGDASPGSARTALRQTLFVLRKALGPHAHDMLVTMGDAITLPADAVQTDVAATERAVAAGTPSALEEAASLYRGDLLAGLSVEAPPFEDWLMSERERLRELALDALARLLAHQRAVAATAPAVQSALRILALDPLQEAAHRTLMRLYGQLGRRDAALRQYQECVAVLQRELAVEPEAETKELYQEILRQRPRRTASLPMIAGLSEAPLVGRDREVTRLHEALAEAWAGRGSVLTVLGEAGIGKSRLLAELAAEAGRRGGSVLLGRAYESERSLPFGPWVGALRDAGVLTDPRALEGLGDAWLAELARLFPELAETNRPVETDAVDQLRLFEALARLLRHLARAHLLVVLLEDCHWADDMTLRFLAFFARRLQSAPMLVATSVREEELTDSPMLHRTLEELAAEGRLARLTLACLGRDETMALVRRLGGADSRGAAQAQRGEQVWAASGGNPFIVIETMRAIGDGVAVEAAGTPLLPVRVREMIARRLDRLSDRARELIRVAAVIGCEFEFALLQRATGLDEREAAEGVEELVRRRVVHGVGDRFDFTHERIREVAYGRLLLPRRRALHGAVAAALEALHAGNLDAHCAALALHYGNGEAWPKALEYLQRAGEQAMARGAYREAAADFDRALGTVGHLPSGRATAQSALELRLRLRNALLPLGDQARMLDNLREAEALAERLGDQRRLGWILSYSALEAWRLGDAERAIGLAERVLALAGALDDVGLRIIAGIRLGQARHSLGRYAEAINILRTTIAASQGDRSRESYGLSAPPSVIARTWLGWCLAERGEFDEGQGYAEEGLAIAGELDQPYPLVAACFGLGLLRLRRGDLDGTIRALERGMALSQVREIPVFFTWTASSLACAYMLAGQVARGSPLLEPPLEPDIVAKAARQAFPFLWLGEAHLLAGRLDAARARARHALKLAQARGERGHEAYALRLEAEIIAREDPPDATLAEKLYCQAIAMAAELGMRPLEAHCHLGLGKLYGRTGDRPKAEDHRTRAATMYREMDMGFWLQKAEAELGPPNRPSP